MRTNIQELLVLSLGTVALSSCSFLGTRQESTKKDVDQNQISQMKVLGSVDEKASSTKLDPTTQKSSLDGVTSATYEAKFLNPTMNAKDFIAQNNVNLDKIDDDQIFSKGMDRASLFFDLGAQLYSKLSVSGTSDENIKFIPAYSPEKVAQIQSDLKCQAPVQSFVVKGEASIDLDDTNVGALMTDAEKEEYAKEGLDLTKVKEFLFKDFSEDVKQLFFESFDPKLNEVKVGIAHQVLYCTQDENNEPKAYLSNYLDYYPLTKDDIHISQEDGRITLTFSKIVGKEELKNLQLSNQQVQTLDKLAYGNGSKKIGVFNEQNYKKLITLTFSLQPAQNPPTPSEASPATPSEIQPVTALNDPAVAPKAEEKQPDITNLKPYRYNPNPYVKNTSYNPISTPVSQSLVASSLATPVIQTNPLSNTLLPSTASTSTSLPAPMSDEEFFGLIQTDDFYQKFAATPPQSPSWINPTLQHSTIKYAYDKKESGYVFVSPDTSFFNNNVYAFDKNPMLTLEEVNSRCANFKHKKHLKFNVNFSSTKNAQNKEYYALKTPEKIYNKSYRRVLLDEFSADVSTDLNIGPNGEGMEDGEAVGMVPAMTATEDDDAEPHSIRDKVLLSLIDSFIAISPEMKKQKWEVKICYGKTKNATPIDYVAYWSSNETASKFAYQNGVITSQKNDRSWIENSFKEEVAPGAAVPEGFNPERKRPHSTMSVVCDPSDHKCYGIFQFAFKREVIAETLMAYLDRSVLKMPKKIYHVFQKARAGGDINRNEMWIAGGFPIDLKQDNQEESEYISPEKLKNKHHIVTASLAPPILATFPGEISDIEYEINPE